MITRIEGVYAERRPMGAVVQVGGLGYEVQVPWSTLEALPALGSQIRLHTVLVIREDSHQLYGFHTSEARDLFRLLIEKVSGIGPKIALGILSHLSPLMLRQAIVQGNVEWLSKCPGIGKKTAQRLILELQAHFQPRALGQALPGTAASAKADSAAPKPTKRRSLKSQLDSTKESKKESEISTEQALATQDVFPGPLEENQGLNASYSDALAALVALGYTWAQADQAVHRSVQALGAQASAEALIRQSLKT